MIALGCSSPPSRAEGKNEIMEPCFAGYLKAWKTQQWLYKTDICIFFVKRILTPRKNYY